MKHIKIWQLPIESEYKFRSYNEVEKHGFSLEDYKLVYECDRPDDYDADTAYFEFNNDHPKDYQAHSLSVSDIVEIDGKKFYCDTFGWKEI